MTQDEKNKRRQEIINKLNQPNFGEKIRMKKEKLTWEQFKKKYKIPVYK